MISMLKKSGFRISSVGQRKNDYAGAPDFFDLWVIDEFMEDNSQSLYETEQRSAYMKAILTLLDGQESRLDGKYERRFLKKANVPIILMIPSAFTNLSTPWWSKRIMPLRFYSKGIGRRKGCSYYVWMHV